MTDGVLAVRIEGKLHILAVFEARAGRNKNIGNISLPERAPPRGSLDDPLSEISQYERYLDDAQEELIWEASREARSRLLHMLDPEFSY